VMQSTEILINALQLMQALFCSG